MTAAFISTSRMRVAGGRGAIAWPRALGCAAFAIVLVLVAAVARGHQPWFDEAQSWLIARDATPWTFLTRVVRYEGTPGLWPMLLYGLQRLGLPFDGWWLVSVSLCAVFVNYQGGPGAPAYYLWSTGDKVPFKPSPPAWNALLSHGEDWALVGDLDQLDPASRTRFDQLAGRQGYCLFKVFPGDVNWKGYAKEADVLDLYGRCGRVRPGELG